MRMNSANKRNQGPTLTVVLVTMAILVCVGIFILAMLIPGESSSRTVLKEAKKGVHSLSEKLVDWIPHHSIPTTVENVPEWEVFWTPIDVEVTDNDPMVILCKLNFKKYWEQPHAYPMFRDLENMSGCVANNRRRERMSVLLKEIDDHKLLPSGRVISPTGFVFHESRVGSTLIANFLASDPWSIVFSESTPIANAILHCTHCSEDQQIELFRNVLRLMGRTPFHKRMFVKFQSITTTKIHIALKAFPDTPWSFVFRQPVQTMMSHLDPQKGSSSAPCLRSKRSPPEEVAIISDVFILKVNLWLLI
jgi:hypothetical protein